MCARGNSQWPPRVTSESHGSACDTCVGSWDQGLQIVTHWRNQRPGVPDPDWKQPKQDGAPRSQEKRRGRQVRSRVGLQDVFLSEKKRQPWGTVSIVSTICTKKETEEIYRYTCLLVWACLWMETQETGGTGCLRGGEAAGWGRGGRKNTHCIPICVFLILEPFEYITYNNNNNNRHIENFQISVYICVFSDKGHSIHKVLKRDCDPGREVNKQFT